MLSVSVDRSLKEKKEMEEKDGRGLEGLPSTTQARGVKTWKEGKTKKHTQKNPISVCFGEDFLKAISGLFNLSVKEGFSFA